MSETSPHNNLRIFLAGGVTGGASTPLFAVASELEKLAPGSQFLFVGTSSPLDRKLARDNGVTFGTLPIAKLPRYVSLQTVLLPFTFTWALCKSFYLIWKYRPHLVFGVGGFTQVPLGFAAFCFKIPIVVHQQDVKVSLSNVLLRPIARKITVSFENSLKDFNGGLFLKDLQGKQPGVWTGNPVRRKILGGSKAEAVQYFKLDEAFPTLLVFGGGSGAAAINEVVWEQLPELTRYFNVIHATGYGKLKNVEGKRYHGYEFISRMDLAYAVADMVVSRAGMSAISELSLLGKFAIIVPLPGTHQEYNAGLLHLAKAAAVVDQEDFRELALAEFLRHMLHKPDVLKLYSQHIHTIIPKDADKKIAHIIYELLIKHD
ncbi:MAG TPA: UDP-N-acetylglucosamine--N-acetylmuramyl-(pentapeptide) pyrophosphoryl-undecaprenol N-acetylglucosamine transferase [Patescibacteria group bacterium]|nr:UDP-N-acetylglucosamine--N-acetylmuramyl-(pentapeptide) pyrophosphoryl-undecaprenol N-acetylglucosamine transferase [Patescibacteria group bacterium]